MDTTPAAHPAINGIQVEKSLMNPDFEGYKLSLENVATFIRKFTAHKVNNK